MANSMITKKIKEQANRILNKGMDERNGVALTITKLLYKRGQGYRYAAEAEVCVRSGGAPPQAWLTSLGRGYRDCTPEEVKFVEAALTQAQDEERKDVFKDMLKEERQRHIYDGDVGDMRWVLSTKNNSWSLTEKSHWRDPEARLDELLKDVKPLSDGEAITTACLKQWTGNHWNTIGEKEINNDCCYLEIKNRVDELIV
jgi:hypothetical protein